MLVGATQAGVRRFGTAEGSLRQHPSAASTSVVSQFELFGFGEQVVRDDISKAEYVSRGRCDQCNQD